MGDVQRVLGSAPLSASQLVTTVYDSLAERNPNREVRFVDPKVPEKAYFGKLRGMLHLVIADDSDPHRSRTGYMSYEAVRVMTIGEKQWLVGCGEKTGDYPGDQYAADVIAVKANSVLPVSDEEAAEAIKRQVRLGVNNMPFSKSLVIAMSDGRIAFPRFGIGTKLAERIARELNAATAERMEQDDRYIAASTLQPLVTRPQSYKPEAVGVVVEGIEAVMREE